MLLFFQLKKEEKKMKELKTRRDRKNTGIEHKTDKENRK